MDNSRFFNQKNLDGIGKIVYQVIGLSKDNEIWISGTGVYIGANLILTAKHVIKDYYERFTSTRLTKDTPLEMRIFCIQYEDKSKPIYLWKVVGVTLSESSDIAILETCPFDEKTAQLTSTEKFKPVLSLKPPNIGDKVCAIGFRKSEIIDVVPDSKGRYIAARAIPSTSIGEVKEIFELLRDRGSLDFPCFQVNFRLDGSMSGGPVLNENGEICGIVCSSLPAQCEEEEHISYITSLWPLFRITMRPVLKHTVECIHLLTFVEAGFIEVVGIDYLRKMEADYN